MEPQIITKDQMSLVGIIGSSADVSGLNIHGLWERFGEYDQNIKNQVGEKGYELHIEEEILPKIHFCLVGVEVEKIEDMQNELFAKVIPLCQYAVFTHRFKDGGYGDAFKAAYQWVRESGFEAAYPFDIQCYDDRFRGPDDPESIMEIYIPIALRMG